MVVLHIQGSTRSSHSWIYNEVHRGRGFMATDKAGKEVSGHMQCMAVVCFEFISVLSSALDITVQWWLLWWICVCYCSLDIMTFLFSWPSMMKSLIYISWVINVKSLKDFRQKWNMTKLVMSSSKVNKRLDRTRQGAQSINGKDWNIPPNRGWIKSVTTRKLWKILSRENQLDVATNWMWGMKKQSGKTQVSDEDDWHFNEKGNKQKNQACGKRSAGLTACWMRGIRDISRSIVLQTFDYRDLVLRRWAEARVQMWQSPAPKC